MTKYTEYFATTNYEYVDDFITELCDAGIKIWKVEKTGEGWSVTWEE